MSLRPIFHEYSSNFAFRVKRKKKRLFNRAGAAGGGAAANNLYISARTSAISNREQPFFAH